ncbi:GtrA family protein, partial [Salmonella enterica]|nr:GtrA family protein [Salmonella enterica]
MRHRSIVHCSNAKLPASKNSLFFIMLKLFAKYTSIGILNTLIHW